MYTNVDIYIYIHIYNYSYIYIYDYIYCIYIRLYITLYHKVFVGSLCNTVATPNPCQTNRSLQCYIHPGVLCLPKWANHPKCPTKIPECSTTPSVPHVPPSHSLSNSPQVLNFHSCHDSTSEAKVQQLPPSYQKNWSGDGSKPWYLVNSKIAGKWMFIPLKWYL